MLIPRKSQGNAVWSWFALELRSDLAPFDLWHEIPDVRTGLSLRIVPDKTAHVQTQLLDAHPATATFFDAPLTVGETFRDTGHEISITLDALKGTTATVTVAMPDFDDVAPSAPASISYTGNTSAVDSAGDRDRQRGDRAVRSAARPHADRDDDRADVPRSRVSHLTRPTYGVTAVDTSENRGLAISLQTSAR